jgi:biotin transport system substrate-specific component
MNARNLGYIAVSTALLCVSAWVAIPLGGIPFTLQTLVLCLSAGLLGAKRGILAVLAYLLLGCIGVPVFAGFMGGIGVLLSPTGGYLVGFLPLSLIVGLAGEKHADKEKLRVLLGTVMGLGVVVCYALGTVWFVLLTAQESTSVGFWSALVTCVLPYIPFDAVKIVFAVVLTEKLRKFIKIK